MTGLVNIPVKISIRMLNPFTPRLVTETFKVVLNFESVDEILWCDYSNKTSSTVLLHGTICILVFYKMKFDI